MNDATTRLAELKTKLRAFRTERGWGNEDPKDVAISLALEAAELLEHFQWMQGNEVKKNPKLFGAVCDELADVLWWVLVMAERLEIDVAKAFAHKMAKNEEKYKAEWFAPDKTPEERDKAYWQVKAKARGSHPLHEEKQS